jgi:hypothetical protein
MDPDGGAMAYLVGVLGAIFGGGAAGGTLLLRQRKKANGNGATLVHLQQIEAAIREGQAESNRRSDALFKNLDEMSSEISHLSGYVEAKLS